MSEIKEFIKAVEKSPCALCEGRTQAVVGFVPDEPEHFGAAPGQKIFCGLCLACLKNLDADFLEAHLRYCGHQTRPWAEKLSTRKDG